MTTRRLLLPLSADLYARLEQAAESEDRDAVQQARVIIRAALENASRKEGDPQ